MSAGTEQRKLATSGFTDSWISMTAN